MKLLFVVFVVFSLSTLGLCAKRAGPTWHLNRFISNEGSLSGTWYNQLGSKMTLNHSLDGTLFGTYHTEVERRLGSAGGVQTLHGRVGQDYPTTLGFTVTFKDGKSTASWSGQYQVCDGQEVLLTTWVLTGHTDTCRDHWSATTIGQDQFTRTPQITEPKSQRKGKKSKKEKSKYHINRKYYDKE